MVNLVIILVGSMIEHSKLTLKSCMQHVSDFYSNIVNRADDWGNHGHNNTLKFNVKAVSNTDYGDLRTT